MPKTQSAWSVASVAKAGQPPCPMKPFGALTYLCAQATVPPVMIEASVVEQKIREGVVGVELLQVEDLTGTKDHYKAVVVASEFEGKSRVQQHQAVYRALGDLMVEAVHALALETWTPEAWQARGD